jgi:LPS-assembly protein
VRAQRRFGDDGVVNAAYRYRRDEFEQVDFSAAIPVSDRIRLIGRWNWSLPEDQVLETFAGIEYESCCYEIRFLGRRYVRNTEGDYANAVYLELELKGLGSLGRRSGDFLRRAILGYR